jgi:hypothetical protein
MGVFSFRHITKVLELGFGVFVRRSSPALDHLQDGEKLHPAFVSTEEINLLTEVLLVIVLPFYCPDKHPNDRKEKYQLPWRNKQY